MAIENQPIAPVSLNEEKPRTDEEQAFIELEKAVMAGQEEEGFTILEDGSAVMGAEEVAPINTDFNVNLADLIDDDELNKISSQLVEGIEKDKSSRDDWEKTYQDGLKYLGMKFDSERSEPFAGASGVIHPLLGEAVTSFQAQAYKELLPQMAPVKTQVVGEYNSVVEEQAQRVKEFMNYQITHVMEEYDAELDQLLFYLPLAGSAFKKVYYDEVLGRAVSKFVAPEDLIVPYYTTDLESCPRITNIIKMPENEVRKLQAQGFYKSVNIDYGESAEQSSQIKEEIEELSGMEQNYDTSEVSVLYEVHCNLNIEGFEDVDNQGQNTGVKLPYIVTIDSNSQQVLSIRRNYLEQDPYKSKIEYFVHFKFLPGLDFMDLV